jgi:dTDP-4-amino-4,6-dideoxygalactose transaminase
MFKMVDLHKQYLRLKPEIDGAIGNVLQTTAFIKGPEVGQFTQSLSTYVKANVVTCGNGTDALQIALMALDLKAGDEIIIPAFTYAAAAEVVLLLNLKPVFADVDRDTFNIDPNDIEHRITSRTRVILPVHLFGQCSDMDAITTIARRHQLYIVEDGAQSLGAEFIFADGTNKKAGTIGSIGTTSFFPSKNLGCFGDGGAIFTPDRILADKMMRIANHGQSEKYLHEVVGINSRLDTLQAAVLDVKLKHIDDFTRRRNEVALTYDRILGNLSTIRIPMRNKNSTHVFHQYTIVAERRNELQQFLKQHHVPSMVYYPLPVHLQQAYRSSEAPDGSLPVAEYLCRNVISLPIHTEMDKNEPEQIGNLIHEFYG